MPQFILVELPSFRLKTMSGQPIALAAKHIGLFSALYQYVRAGLVSGTPAGISSSSSPTTTNPELSASLLFAGGEPDTWTSCPAPGLHAEEALLAGYFHSFDLPGAYPIVDALLMSHKPCSSCLGYFSQAGKTLRDPSSSSSVGSSGASSSSSRSGSSRGGSGSSRSGGGSGGGRDGAGSSFRARFTPRSDRSYTPIFYLARSLDAESRAGLWFEMTSMWGSTFLPSSASSLGLGLGSVGGGGGESGLDELAGASMLARGQMYWLVPGSAWFAVHEQETMTDAEIAEVVMQQNGMLGYWIGR